MDPAYTKLVVPAETKIVLVVLDGLGGLRTSGAPSELSAAKTPNLDALAAGGSIGLQTVVAPGITPGSGAGHLALFGYDPLDYEIGRGALSAAGLGFHLMPGDVAARVNLCTLDDEGNISDRRAGRIDSGAAAALCAKVGQQLDLGGEVEVSLLPEREHRALLVLRGAGLSPDIDDTDPQLTGVPPKAPHGRSGEADRTVKILAELLAQVRRILAGEKANFMLLRGFDTARSLQSFDERYQMRAQGIAGYPMYIGIARLLGMDAAPAQPSWESEVKVLGETWADHDFFYIHQKKTDSAGEDGDFDKKVAAIEDVDATIPAIMSLSPDVICVTGDHSTPSPMRAHSWHPVPFLMHGPLVGIDRTVRFDEQEAATGGLGHVRGIDLMPLMMAAASRLTKYGA